MSLAARAGARQVECRTSHRDTSAFFGVPSFSAISGGMNASMKASQFPRSHWMTTSSFIVNTLHRLLQGLRPLANTRRFGAAAARPSRSAAAIGRYGVAQSQPRRPSPALRWDNRRAGLEGDTGPVKASARLRRTRPLARGLLRHSHDQ